jgi:UrcA family protein
MSAHSTHRPCLRLSVAALVATWAGLLSHSALAGPLQDAVPRQVVRFADLDLNSSDDVATLYRLVHLAAEEVCSGFNSRDLGLTVHWRGCIADATQRAVAKIDVPALTQYYRNREAVPDTRIARTN